ncbi:putative transcriptional regulator [Paenibacillus sp. PastF-3]|uniref:helix-turn-helix transcriptional regulator n=1 Tax=unclassified Paenibacillus TaxID=185978 RepID=UPI00211ACE13|nr:MULTISPECIES: helix-turn-helix transcriptional regulator [unclassified Paenibacillus]MDH6372901.1 putative transcriptional regulator [Paenibacillus sp. PastF-3]
MKACSTPQYIITNDLKGIRKANQLSQQKLAKSVGADRQTIIKIEKGGSPELWLAFAIARYFKMDINDVFFCEIL